MPIFNDQEIALNYATFGDKSNPALLLSNSLGTSYHMWQPQIDALQNDYFIICYDTRGHGKSSAPKGPYNLDQLGQDVIDLLDHLNIDKAFFCGISMGGMTGQWLAINHPDVVKALSAALAAGSSEGYASCCEALSVADTREQLKNVRVPVTVLSGIEDPVTTVADGQYMVDHIPNAKLATIDASHISNIEQPEAFNQLVRQYLKH